jgi:hypothetical protein
MDEVGSWLNFRKLDLYFARGLGRHEPPHWVANDMWLFWTSFTERFAAVQAVLSDNLFLAHNRADIAGHLSVFQNGSAVGTIQYLATC